MVRRKSTSRLSSIILAQADTTVGFISQDAKKLASIKSRPQSKPFIKIYNSLLACESRIPHAKRKFLRRAKKTTFIVKNQAFRIVPHAKSSQILRDISWHYSTSANESGKKFSIEFCEDKADIIIEDSFGLKELQASKLIKLNNKKLRRLRWINF